MKKCFIICIFHKVNRKLSRLLIWLLVQISAWDVLLDFKFLKIDFMMFICPGGEPKPNPEEFDKESSPFDTNSSQWKPQVPKRFVRPKLIKVKRTGNRRSSLDRPRDPAPPPPNMQKAAGSDNQAFDVNHDRLEVPGEETPGESEPPEVEISVHVDMENSVPNPVSSDDAALVDNEYVSVDVSEPGAGDSLADTMLDMDSDLMSEILAEVSSSSRASLSRASSSANEYSIPTPGELSSPEHVSEVPDHMKTGPSPLPDQEVTPVSSLRNVDNRTPTPFVARTQQAALAVVHATVSPKVNGEVEEPRVGTRKDIPVATIRPMQGSCENLRPDPIGDVRGSGSMGELSYQGSNQAKDFNEEQHSKSLKKTKNPKDLRVHIPGSPSLPSSHSQEGLSDSRLELTLDPDGTGRLTLHLGDASHMGEESTTDEVADGLAPTGTPPDQIITNSPTTPYTPGVGTPLTTGGEGRRSRRSRHRPRVPPPPPPPTTSDDTPPPPVPTTSPPSFDDPDLDTGTPSPIPAPRRSRRGTPLAPLTINVSLTPKIPQVPSPSSPKPQVPPKPKMEKKRRMSEPVRSPSSELSPPIRPNSTSPKKDMPRNNAMTRRRRKISGPPKRPPPPRPPPPSSPDSDTTSPLTATLRYGNQEDCWALLVLILDD